MGKPISRSRAVTVWESQMAEAAQQQASMEVVGGHKSISLRGGIMAVDGTPIKGNELRCVVLVSAHENQFFRGKFDPNAIVFPDCYAFSLDGADSMAPHADASDPQSDTCKNCPNNEMGTADTGRGKACKNIRRLLVTTPDSFDSPEALENAEIRRMNIPVTSTNLWAKYVHKLTEEIQRPAFGVITKISLVPDTKTQFKVLFEFEGLVNFNQKLWETLQTTLTSLKKEIVAPYPKNEDSAPQVSSRGGNAKINRAGAAAKKATSTRGRK